MCLGQIFLYVAWFLCHMTLNFTAVMQHCETAMEESTLVPHGANFYASATVVHAGAILFECCPSVHP